MSITKKSDRQELISAMVTVNATDFDATIVGTASTSTLEVLDLPEGAKIVSGALNVVTAFNSGGVRANGVLTSTAAPIATNTVTIGTQVYTFQAILTASTTANEVLIGVSEATSLDNLAAAINGTGTPGVDYGSETVPRTDVTAVSDGVHTLTITAVPYDSSLDTLATTETHANATWGDTTLEDYVATSDTVASIIGAVEYKSAASVATGSVSFALVPTGTQLGANGDTVDLLWDLADTATLAPTAGEVQLIVNYVVDGRAAFSQG
jgi:hypothetical protein